MSTHQQTIDQLINLNLNLSLQLNGLGFSRISARCITLGAPGNGH
jgi:hypothetical protein